MIYLEHPRKGTEEVDDDSLSFDQKYNLIANKFMNADPFRNINYAGGKLPDDHLLGDITLLRKV